MKKQLTTLNVVFLAINVLVLGISLFFGSYRRVGIGTPSATVQPQGNELDHLNQTLAAQVRHQL